MKLNDLCARLQLDTSFHINEEGTVNMERSGAVYNINASGMERRTPSRGGSAQVRESHNNRT